MSCSSKLVAEIMFVCTGRLQILSGARGYNARGWGELGLYHLGWSCSGRVHGALDVFVGDKEGSSLEIDDSTPFKTTDHLEDPKEDWPHGEP